jgi:threonyl-tRNA synthetase
MKLLFIHADHLKFEARRPAVKGLPPLPPGAERGEADEALVVFFSVERQDLTDPGPLLSQAVQNVEDVLGQVKAERVVLYPYAHLSQDLAPPREAQRLGEELRERLSGSLAVPVLSAPFGYYKAFTLQAKGHPLAELSRTILPRPAPSAPAGPSPTPGGSVPVESAALGKERTLASSWVVLTPDGRMTPASEFDFAGDEDFAAFYRYETGGSRQAGQEPAHVRLMREMELVDYEPGSDAGNFRWYPRGQLMKRLLEEQCSRAMARAGAMRVETPIMYDFEHPALRRYLDRFPARQYVVRSEEKEYFLRFAACFGQYLIFHDMVIGRKDLPVRLYELTHYSFRREQTGELSGLRRLRTFTMPDMHTAVADVEQAKEEFRRQFALCRAWMADLAVPYQAALRLVRSFFEEHRAFVLDLVRDFGRPILLELWEERFFYFVMKFEFHPLDTQGRAAALSTVQIDVENAERFGIGYTDRDGARKTPLLLHASIPGAVERNVYALLEEQARRTARGEKPQFPFWLAPTQLRVLPVSDPFLPAALHLADALTASTGARVDVDDRDEGISRKIRDAERAWVPLVVVFGEREARGEALSVRGRDGRSRSLTLDELSEEVRQRQGEFPQAPLPEPQRLSVRPVFRG